MAKKPSIGRQKIKIAKIQVKNHLQVTFSKRRSGLFKKASELSTLCGVEIAIIVFSPAGKVFSFGHPNVEYIIDQFSTHNSAPISAPFSLVQAQRNACVRELNLQLGQVLNELESEKKRGETLDNMRKNNEKQYWWEAHVEKMELREVDQLKNAMEELRKNVAEQEMKFAEVMNRSMVFGLNGTGGVFDQYESKPSQVLGDQNNVLVKSNFGYYHGYF